MYEQSGAAVTNGNDTGESGKATRVNPQAAAPGAPQPESAITTAEIPHISVPASPQFTRGDGWHPDIERRLPAPWGVELAVWILFVLFVLGLIGLAAEHFHPGWVASLRNTTSVGRHHGATGVTSTTTPSSGSSTTQPSRTLGKLVLLTTSKSSVTYSVPTSSSFTIVVSTTNPCYTLVKSPPGAAHFVFAATITPKQSPETISVGGSASVILSAQASAITIKVGSKQVGSIAPPRAFITYTFTPSGH